MPWYAGVCTSHFESGVRFVFHSQLSKVKQLLTQSLTSGLMCAQEHNERPNRKVVLVLFCCARWVNQICSRNEGASSLLRVFFFTCEVFFMMNSLGCDKHNRAQSARERNEDTSHTPSLWSAQGVSTVPSFSFFTSRRATAETAPRCSMARSFPSTAPQVGQLVEEAVHTLMALVARPPSD